MGLLELLRKCTFYLLAICLFHACQRFGNATDAVITVNFQSGQIAFVVQVSEKLVTRLFGFPTQFKNKICLVVSMILAFPLQFLPVRSISESYVFSADDDSIFMRWLWRISLVVLIGFLGSIARPDFALVYGFVGGFAGCLLAFVLPIVIFISLEKPKGRSFTIHVLLLAIALTILLVSSVSSGAALIKNLARS